MLMSPDYLPAIDAYGIQILNHHLLGEETPTLEDIECELLDIGYTIGDLSEARETLKGHGLIKLPYEIYTQNDTESCMIAPNFVGHYLDYRSELIKSLAFEHRKFTEDTVYRMCLYELSKKNGGSEVDVTEIEEKLSEIGYSEEEISKGREMLVNMDMATPTLKADNGEMKTTLAPNQKLFDITEKLYRRLSMKSFFN